MLGISQTQLTFDQIIVMLSDTKRVPKMSRRIQGIILLIEKYKISSPLTKEWEYKLIGAGATDTLLTAAKDYSPSTFAKTPSPDVLIRLKKLLRYDEIQDTISYSGLGQKFYRIKIGNKWGYIDRFGNEIVPPKYDDLGFLSWGGYFQMNVEQPNSTWYSTVKIGNQGGVLDLAQGGKLLFLKDGLIIDSQCGEKAFKTNQGLYDINGARLLSTQFKEFHCEFVDGLVAVSDGTKWGFADSSETIRVPLKYKEVGDFVDGLARVEVSEEKCGYIDKKGAEVIPIQYGYCEDFVNGKAVVGSEYAKRGVIDRNNKEIIPLSYADVVLPPSNNLPENMLEVCSTLNEEQDPQDCGLLDWSGKKITPLSYYRPEYWGELGYPWHPFWFKEGVAWICKLRSADSSVCGAINEQGKVVIPFKYDDMRWLGQAGILTGDFHEGLSRIVLNGKIGYIDKAGRELSIKYAAGYRFSEGLAKVCIDDPKDPDEVKRWICGFIDRSGKEITALKYEPFGSTTEQDIQDKFNYGFAMVKVNDKFGFIDRTGKEVIPVKYDNVWLWDTIQDGIVGVTLNGRKGFVDVFGNEYFD